MHKLARFVVVPAALAAALAGAALAKGGHPQTHHCKLPGGSMDNTKTHRQCTAAKGSWVKDAPATGAGSGSASAPSKPAPAPSKPAPSK